MSSDRLRANIRKMREEIMRAAERGMYQGGEELLTYSKGFVPVEFGTLRASGSVTRPEVRGNRIKMTIGYGGSAAEYALIVHERLDVHHPVGQAKYLEQPVNERGHLIFNRTANEIRRALR